MNIEKISWFALRISVALMFLWAFADKLFGLGFSTQSENSWIHGGSPTYGFLTFGTEGPFADMFKPLAGVALIDWMFMLGLLFVGLTLLLNRFVALGALAGMIMMFLMWLATFPPENNPFIDDHIIYFFVLAVLAIESHNTKKQRVNEHE